MLTVFIVLIVLIISGLIAYLGDLVGRKVGKRKLSIFGLRPKYTSVIITIITGILIASFSITIILVAFRNVRNAVFNIEEVLSELVILSMQVRSQNNQLRSMQKEIEESESLLEMLSTEKNDLLSELEMASREYIDAHRQLQDAQLEISKLESDREGLRQALQEQEERLASLTGQRCNLEEKIEQLEERTYMLQSAYELMERDYNRRYEELGRLYQTLDQRYQEYSVGDIIYLRGEEVHWTVIYGGQSEQDIYRELDHFLRESNRAAEILGIQGVEPGSDSHILYYAGDYLAVAQELRRGEGRFIVRLVAEGNTTRTQVLKVRFQIIQDYVVYAKGEELYSILIDPRLNLSALESELMGLFEGLRESALSNGILPDYSNQIGSIDFTTFFRLLEELREHEEKVRIVVVANEDIWRIDSLTQNVSYLVIPAGEDD